MLSTRHGHTTVSKLGMYILLENTLIFGVTEMPTLCSVEMFVVQLRSTYVHAQHQLVRVDGTTKP